MKRLCRMCHDIWCRVADCCKPDDYMFGECEKCGRWVESGVVCYGYDFRENRNEEDITTDYLSRG